jgi:Tol biopolymer transport system component
MRSQGRFSHFVIAFSAISMLYLSGCTSLNAQGMKRVSPFGEEWSHVSGVSWSPDGSKLASTWMFGGSDLIPEGYIYINDLESEEPRILSHTKAQGEFTNPAWSPTCGQIAFYSSGWAPRGIWLVDIYDVGHPPSFLAEGTSCAWAPDGERIAVANSMGSVYTITILDTRTNGRREALRMIPEEGYYVRAAGISWSSRDRLAFSFGLDDHDGSTIDTEDIYVLDLTSGEYRVVVGGGHNLFPSWSPDGSMIAFAGGESLPDLTLLIHHWNNDSTLKLLDVTGVGPVAWSPDGSRIAFEWKGSVYFVETSVALEGFVQ